jgi:hypothetical protein
MCAPRSRNQDRGAVNYKPGTQVRLNVIAVKERQKHPFAS